MLVTHSIIVHVKEPGLEVVHFQTRNQLYSQEKKQQRNAKTINK
jgi:hypothetical protein